MSLEENLNNRKWLISRLRAEVIGPDPVGEQIEIVPGGAPRKFTWEEFRKPQRQRNNEEIIKLDPPSKRYGAGILYPAGVTDQILQAVDDGEPPPVNAPPPDERQDVDEKMEKVAEKKASRNQFALEESEDYDVTLANAFRPSAVGLSFLADFDIESEGFTVEVVSLGRSDNENTVEIPSAVYRKASALVGDFGKDPSPRDIWLRVPALDHDGKYPQVPFSKKELLSATAPIRKQVTTGPIRLEIVAVSRGGYARLRPNERLITVSLVNREKQGEGKIDEKCLFQSGIRICGKGKSPWIQAYPETEVSKLGDESIVSDERINRVLYRQHQTFAIGHGCAADWHGNVPEMVSEVWTDVLPAFETPSTSADLFITDSDGVKQTIRVSMRKLAGLDAADNGEFELNKLVGAYASWISSLRGEREGIGAIPEIMMGTAKALISRCETCLERIRDGIAFLNENSDTAKAAREAFRLANHAMLIAQLRSSRTIREPKAGPTGGIYWEPPIVNPDILNPDEKRGYWRAFQIAFLLMSLRGIADPQSADRDTVDLIWFPTGGGKTEAYLGLTAFTIFFNRLSGCPAGGTDVLMRYTLRLLTAQQFQRAALLFCAMEYLRRRDSKLGERRFSIGLWVGGSASPNKRDEALHALKKLEKDSDSENPFILLKCPWCGSKFGPSSSESGERNSWGKRGRERNVTIGVPSVLGYRRYRKSTAAPETVVFCCNDGACEFGSASSIRGIRPLPIVVIDEDLLADPPNLVIGTVDKFAMLAWKPEVRGLFGLDQNGRHTGLPPTLIIQDELHLISGPLGSMVGAYETVIESLCRQNGQDGPKPKIIASTATISRATDQVRHLYARENVFLFPPSGLEANDSFFAREARNDDGSMKPGRMYVGILAPAHGSLQTTEARVFACIMQHVAIMNTDDSGRDPWWTLLCFFNSLRELGSAASLFVSDTRDYLRIILDRQGIPYDKIRKLFNVSELTSRIRSDQVPKELERLEKSFASIGGDGGKDPIIVDAVDACLASNIIEVGVDVSRLALMAIVGQPKTTSQYIQVSSRIGRDPEKPGLVTILYGQSKPRDRSHYERFRPYHQRLYAEVEPTSVTPFSAPAVDRALHGLIVAAVRQLGDSQVARLPDPFPLAEGSRLRDLIEDMIGERVKAVSEEEHEAVMAKLQKRLDEWRIWQPREYGGFGAPPEDPPLIHPAGSTEPASWDSRSWPTMTSLRNVDAPCEAEVTGFFNKLRENNQ